MDLGLKDKVAVIGGSSKGLGRGCAVSLAREGVKIVLCARDRSALDVTAKEIVGLGVALLPLEVDMSLKEDNERVVKETIGKFGRIDILVNNSGGPSAGTFFDFEEEAWRQAFDSVLMYVIRMCRLTIPHMRKNNWGRIINLTSLSVKEPAETLVLSNVFRSGVVSLAKSMSRELIKSHITINNICPGAFKTDRAVELMKKTAEQKKITVAEVENEAIKNMPLGRYQKPEELGDLVAYLCSELAGGLTGTTIQIDGGMAHGLL